MANHIQFNKIVHRLKDRNFYCKTFYEPEWHKAITLNSQQVYLKSDIDDIIDDLKSLYDSQENIIRDLKKKINDTELENYKLKKEKKAK
jgi:hypothetical protein